MFCLTGVMFGTLMGYYIGVNRKSISHHIHHIKAITCHHYNGIEVHYLISRTVTEFECRDYFDLYFFVFW